MGQKSLHACTAIKSVKAAGTKRKANTPAVHPRAIVKKAATNISRQPTKIIPQPVIKTAKQPLPTVKQPGPRAAKQPGPRATKQPANEVAQQSAHTAAGMKAKTSSKADATGKACVVKPTTVPSAVTSATQALRKGTPHVRKPAAPVSEEGPANGRPHVTADTAAAANALVAMMCSNHANKHAVPPIAMAPASLQSQPKNCCKKFPINTGVKRPNGHPDATDNSKTDRMPKRPAKHMYKACTVLTLP